MSNWRDDFSIGLSYGAKFMSKTIAAYFRCFTNTTFTNNHSVMLKFLKKSINICFALHHFSDFFSPKK